MDGVKPNIRGWRGASRWIARGVALGLLGGCPAGEAGPSASSATATATATGGSTTSGGSGSTGFDTFDSASGDGSTAAPVVEVGCGEPAAAAVGAQFEHALEVSPAEGSWTWAVEGLPDGLTVSPLNGRISGTPLESGSFPFDVVVTGSGGQGEAQCELVVAEALQFDLGSLSPPCIGPQDDLASFVQGGDGSALRCSTPGGSGDGARPEAVEVGARSCAIEGEPTGAEYGTWVWITQVEQAGNFVPVPYCVTQPEPEPDAYEVRGRHGGQTEAALLPMVRTFDPRAPLDLGGDEDPFFEVEGPCGPGSCFFGYSFVVGPSPFGDCETKPCFGVDPAVLLRDDDDNPIGFTHEMFARGPAPQAFADRPFVLSWDLTYCLADNDQDCSDGPSIIANGGGRLHFSWLLLPG